jgi:hypothetical protein
MKNHITAVLAAALLASLTSIAAAAPTTPSGHPAKAREADESKTIGMQRVTIPRPKPTPADPDRSGIDRTFHPDYSHAVTVEQMNAAWNAEINRVFETPIAGGG